MLITGTNGAAKAAGILPGETLLQINGQPIIDLIDYEFLAADEDLRLLIESGGSRRVAHIKKDVHEPLGVDFDIGQMLQLRSCKNNCVFCFVDQLPRDVRPSLMVKDDDWRMSLLMGNYVTLTNVDDKELKRMVARQVSPLYISVHSTDDGLRRRLLGVKNAPDILRQLSKLAQAGITLHCQVVLCPGWNDGPALDKTLRDLAGLYPHVASVALVPVGLTGHRAGLTGLKPYDKTGAVKLLRHVERWQQEYLARLGTRLVFAADEFYVLAEEAPPPYEANEDFPQIENGVGLIAKFEREVDDALEDARGKRGGCFTLVTGMSAAEHMRRAAGRISAVTGARLSVLPVKNAFFGESVTVAGLLTGGDVMAALAQECGGGGVLLPRCMLREDEDVFLDGMALEELRAGIERKIDVVEIDGEKLVGAVLE